MKIQKPTKLNLMKNRTLAMHNNENGFTLIELLVASTISLILLALVASVLTSQSETFVLQNQLNKVESNGRAAVDFISRAVQNSGFNVFRGQRFLAASDHYVTSVYDEDNDGVIENDEVMTFAASNVPTAVTNTFNIASFWDVDGNGTVAGDENRTYAIGLNLAGPPFNLYKVLPNASDDGNPPYSYSRIAQDIDNIIIRYYDRNGLPLPAGVAVDGNGRPVPPFTVPVNELNNIRRVEVDVVARTKDPDPRSQYANADSYPAGSLAEVVTGGTAFTDSFHRKTYVGTVSPRNLAMVPWGKMDLEASDVTINCPNNTTTLTATMVDGSGTPPPAGTRIKFAFAGAGATASPDEDTSNSSGQASTVLTYDWSQPAASFTVSASALVDAGGGAQRSIFSSTPVSFVSGSGTFTDLFNGGMDPNWVELDSDPDIIEVDTDADFVNDALQMSATGLTRAVNGCIWQKFKLEFEMTPDGDIDFGAIGPAMVGGYLRYQDQNNNYSVLIEKTGGNCVGGDGMPYCLKIVKWNGALTTLGNPLGANLDFTSGIKYKVMAEMDDHHLRAKIWNANLPTDPVPGLGLADPNPGDWDYDPLVFPAVYRLDRSDSDYPSGKVGLIGDWTNGANVVFDNLVVNTLP